MKSSEFPMPADWHQTMLRINAEVNLCKFEADPPNEDKWGTMSDGTGHDCDNFAIEKAERLAKLLPIQRIRLATCWMGADGGRKQGQGHLVCVVDGPHEQYVLSNGREPLTHQQFWATQWMRDGIQEVGGSQKWIKWENV